MRINSFLSALAITIYTLRDLLCVFELYINILSRVDLFVNSRDNEAHTTGAINMKEEQFEAIVAVGVRFSLAVEKCDSEFVLDDILTEGIGGRFEVNPDWEDYKRTSIYQDKDFGRYKVTGIVRISPDRQQWDYETAWEKIA
jgi:hypothetical protein